jgi:hypothetical protein
MQFPDLKIQSALGVLAVPVDQLAVRDATIDRTLVSAFSADYNQTGGSTGTGEGSDEGLPLILESRGGQITITNNQATLDVTFYGGHQTDPDACRGFFGDKMLALLKAWNSVGARPVWANVMITLKASFGNEPDRAGAYIRDNLLAEAVTDDAVYDVKAQLGIRVANHYFINLSVSPYEAKQVRRNATGSSVTAVIRPWEGEVTDTGIDLNVETNNRLLADVLQRHSPVDADELREMNELSWDFVAHVATPFVRDGQLDLSRFQAVAS